MYIVINKVKKKALSLGYRTDKSFIHGLDEYVEQIIKHVSSDWTRPKKTMTSKDLIAYLTHHHITL